MHYLRKILRRLIVRLVFIWGSCGFLLCCITLSASVVYHLTVDQLHQYCFEHGMHSDGQARTLRCRLAEPFKRESME